MAISPRRHHRKRHEKMHNVTGEPNTFLRIGKRWKMPRITASDDAQFFSWKLCLPFVHCCWEMTRCQCVLQLWRSHCEDEAAVQWRWFPHWCGSVSAHCCPSYWPVPAFCCTLPLIHRWPVDSPTSPPTWSAFTRLVLTSAFFWMSSPSH